MKDEESREKNNMAMSLLKGYSSEEGGKSKICERKYYKESMFIILFVFPSSPVFSTGDIAILLKFFRFCSIFTIPGNSVLFVPPVFSGYVTPRRCKGSLRLNP